MDYAMAYTWAIWTDFSSEKDASISTGTTWTTSWATTTSTSRSCRGEVSPTPPPVPNSRSVDRRAVAVVRRRATTTKKRGRMMRRWRLPSRCRGVGHAEARRRRLDSSSGKLKYNMISTMPLGSYRSLYIPPLLPRHNFTLVDVNVYLSAW
jgi:hypothetical protein